MKTKGQFIVIEGTDGSGKSEQTKLLVERLKKSGYAVYGADFPQYKFPSAYFVEKYLNGAYGTWRDVGPYKASLFFALDRFDAASKIREAIDGGGVVVSNRYVASNLGHQGAKINDPAERRKFFEWDYETEYGILGIPKPDLNIILHVPAKVAYELVAQKGEREYLAGAKRDIHEADIAHLTKAEQAYLEIAGLFLSDFTVVECVDGGKLLPIEEVHEKVWQTVSGSLKI